MSAPKHPPLGLQLSRSSREIGRAFSDALASANGSLPSWLILLALKTGRSRNQRELAEVVGIQGATLTHHLNAMESDGLVTRRRDPDNRRVHIVEMTDAGERRFLDLRTAAMGFDHRLRKGIAPTDISHFIDTLERLRVNVADESA